MYHEIGAISENAKNIRDLIEAGTLDHEIAERNVVECMLMDVEQGIKVAKSGLIREGSLGAFLVGLFKAIIKIIGYLLKILVAPVLALFGLSSWASGASAMIKKMPLICHRFIDNIGMQEGAKSLYDLIQREAKDDPVGFLDKKFIKMRTELSDVKSSARNRPHQSVEALHGDIKTGSSDPIGVLVTKHSVACAMHLINDAVGSGILDVPTSIHIKDIQDILKKIDVASIEDGNLDRKYSQVNNVREGLMSELVHAKVLMDNKGSINPELLKNITGIDSLPTKSGIDVKKEHGFEALVRDIVDLKGSKYNDYEDFIVTGKGKKIASNKYEGVKNTNLMDTKVTGKDVQKGLEDYYLQQYMLDVDVANLKAPRSDLGYVNLPQYIEAQIDRGTEHRQEFEEVAKALLSSLASAEQSFSFTGSIKQYKATPSNSYIKEVTAKGKDIERFINDELIQKIKEAEVHENQVSTSMNLVIQEVADILARLLTTIKTDIFNARDVYSSLLTLDMWVGPLSGLFMYESFAQLINKYKIMDKTIDNKAGIDVLIKKCRDEQNDILRYMFG